MDAFNHDRMITGLVTVMMLVVEYVNVLTQREWQKRLDHDRRQRVRYDHHRFNHGELVTPKTFETPHPFSARRQ